eukprot:COSAG05_NODE_798_length_7245_cov_46.630982_8_plen_155_part_00
MCEPFHAGRSAITWLESAPWVNVWAFDRYLDGGTDAVGRNPSNTSPDHNALSLGQIDEIRLTLETATEFLDGRYNGLCRRCRASADVPTLVPPPRRYNHGKYGQRFHSVAARQTLDGDEFARLAAEHSLPRCDVIAVYGSTMVAKPGKRLDVTP